MSFDIATTIFRTVSASASGPYVTRSNLVTPSTRSATSPPKSVRNCSIEYEVSSTVSCSKAAIMVEEPIPNSANI